MEDAITETEDEEEEDDGDYSDSVTSVGDDEEEGEGGERDISDISEEDEEDWEVGASICRVPFCPFFGGCYGGVVRFCCQALGAAIFFLFRRCKKMLTVELQVYSHFPTFRRPYVSFYRPMQTDFFPPINSRGTVVVVDVPTLPHRPGLQYPVRFDFRSHSILTFSFRLACPCSSGVVFVGLRVGRCRLFGGYGLWWSSPSTPFGQKSTR